MEKQTAALLLARGPVNKSFELNTPIKYKALFEINGRPMVDYVLRALQESDVEKIFIVQGEDEGLEKVVTESEKNVFLTCNQKPSSYASSFLLGLEKAMEHYGRDEFRRRNILVVPCDIPFAKKENFNSLIAGNNRNSSDISLLIIDRRYLEERYPERRFRYIYLKDMDGMYTMQGLIFLNGASVKMRGSEGHDTTNIVISGREGNALAELSDIIDSLHQNRARAYQWLHLLYNLVRLLAKRRNLLSALKFIFSLSKRELTAEQIKHTLNIATGLRFDYFESKEAELSGDIDRPEHLEALSDMEPDHNQSVIKI